MISKKDRKAAYDFAETFPSGFSRTIIIDAYLGGLRAGRREMESRVMDMFNASEGGKEKRHDSL